MREVMVAGVGMTPFGVFPERRLEDLRQHLPVHVLADGKAQVVEQRRRQVHHRGTLDA